MHSVRLLTPADMPIYRTLRLEALRLHPEAYGSHYSEWETLSDADWNARMSIGPFVAALNNGTPTGIMGLRREPLSKMAHRATLINVYVKADFRGTGIAESMLARIDTAAAAIGIRQIELAVSAENPAAVRFYEREGFNRVGTIPGGFLHDGREIDEILMTRRTGLNVKS